MCQLVAVGFCFSCFRPLSLPATFLPSLLHPFMCRQAEFASGCAGAGQQGGAGDGEEDEHAGTFPPPLVRRAVPFLAKAAQKSGLRLRLTPASAGAPLASPGGIGATSVLLGPPGSPGNMRYKGGRSSKMTQACKSSGRKGGRPKKHVEGIEGVFGHVEWFWSC